MVFNVCFRPPSGGYTVVLKSKGPAAKNQRDCLGVYRVVDSLNDKPVYKQDAGDHYLYYHGGHDCWLVGSRVGQEIGWIKNQPLLKAASGGRQLGLTDLPTGWQYQPVAMVGMDGSWLADDDSLTVEVLKGERGVRTVAGEVNRASGCVRFRVRFPSNTLRPCPSFLSRPP